MYRVDIVCLVDKEARERSASDFVILFLIEENEQKVTGPGLKFGDRKGHSKHSCHPGGVVHRAGAAELGVVMRPHDHVFSRMHRRRDLENTLVPR